MRMLVLPYVRKANGGALTSIKPAKLTDR